MATSFEATPQSKEDRDQEEIWGDVTSEAVKVLDWVENAGEVEQSEKEDSFNALEGALVQLAKEIKAGEHSNIKHGGWEESVSVYEKAAEKLGRPTLVYLDESTSRVRLISNQEDNE